MAFIFARACGLFNAGRYLSARRRLESLDDLAADDDLYGLVQALKGDIELQLGLYADARASYRAMLDSALAEPRLWTSREAAEELGRVRRCHHALVRRGY